MSEHFKAPLCDLCSNFLEDVSSSRNSNLDEKGGAWEATDPTVKAAYRKAHPLQFGASSMGKGLAPIYRHYTTFEALCNSTKQCRLCNLLCCTLQQQLQEINRNLALQLKVFNENSPWNVVFSASIGSQEVFFQIYYRDNLKARAALRDFRESLPPFIPPARTISQNVFSHECRDLALTWLHECLSSHKSCRQRTKAPLPKRVIDVGPSNGNKDPVLMISNGRTAPYIALSYCWGDPIAMLTTRTENIIARTQGIPMTSLPRTLQDAVRVTRALNIRYLWIDALCIIQDSAEDWMAQAAVMGHIFEGAILTISAAGADDSQSGFLHERLSAGNDICCKVNLDSASQYDIHVRVRQPSISDSLDTSRIASRAWTMQERLLSRRVLHFGKEQIGWECPELTEAEGAMAGCGTGFSVMTMTKGLLSPANTKHIVPGRRYVNSTTSTGQQRWEDIIEQYTSREISIELDRLPALASIAEKYSGEMTYLAGIWDELLPRALMWRPISLTAKPATNKVPSWSWASIIGGITYNQVYELGGNQTDWHAEILSAEVWDSGPQYMGQVSGGEIKVSGILTKAFYSFPDSEGASGQLIYEEGASVKSEPRKNEAWMDIDPTTPRQSWCLWMGSALSFRDRHFSYSLLLQEVDISKLVFKRCGIAKLPKEESSEILRTAQKQILTLI